MAEGLAILGALSSVFQIVDFVTKLTTHTRSIIDSTADAPSYLAETEDLAHAYERVAASVLEAKGKLDPQAQNHRLSKEETFVLSTAADCQKSAKELLGILDGFKKNSTLSGWARISDGTHKAASYLKQQKDIDNRIQILQRQNGVLHTSLLASYGLRKKEVSEMILNDLAFTDMQLRADTVTKAYHSTFEWAVTDQKLGLRTWLESGDGIYWITGKPGSGKSTLMKFLASHSTMHELLRTWSKGARVHSASFYFWYLGSTMQKSIVGLMRSILHQLLSIRPDLVKTICSEYFNSHAKGLPDGSTLWTHDRLLQALTMFVRTVNSCEDSHFCLFIDGLDEYDGDHLAPIKILVDLTKNKGIKLCLASRPWNAFRNAFEHACPWLRMEDLTKSDVHTFVHDRIRTLYTSGSVLLCDLGNGVDLAAVDKLIDDVVSKAEGVFLWVYLVVAAIERGFAEGDSILTLQRRVEAFPPDLEKFFQQLIFDTVDKFYVKQTCQALFLECLYVATPARESSKFRSFIDFWVLAQHPEGLQGPESVYRMQFQPGLLTEPRRASMVEDTKRFLSASCKDLLILHRDSYRVEFLHRTVYDFLSLEHIREALVSNVPTLFTEGYRVIHLLNLVKLQYCWDYDVLRQVCRYSLSSPHTDLNERYALRCEKTLLNYPESQIQQDAIATLVSFHCYYLVNKIALRPSQHSGIQYVQDIQEWLKAALGLRSTNLFAFSKVSLALLSTVMGLARGVNVLEPDSGSLERAECASDLWAQIFRRWSLYERDHQISESEAAWTIAKLLLTWAPLPDKLFCSARDGSKDGPSHRHTWCGASEFLCHTVPAIELARCPVTAHLAKDALRHDSFEDFRPASASRRSQAAEVGELYVSYKPSHRYPYDSPQYYRHHSRWSDSKPSGMRRIEKPYRSHRSTRDRLGHRTR